MAEGKWISYLRVSTDRQGASGLGVEAQRHSVAEYLNGGRWKLIKEFVEIEGGSIGRLQASWREAGDSPSRPPIA
jgi:DNA invertase Pin-like site-specific DNA recombinase